MGVLNEYFSIVIALATLVGMVGSHYLRQGKQDNINEQNEKRFGKIETRQDKHEESSDKFMNEIRSEFKSISGILTEMKEARIEQKHEYDMNSLKMRQEMKEHLELSRLDFLRIFGTKPLDELRKEQK